jgi:uncharacterized protein (TIGR02231 family)
MKKCLLVLFFLYSAAHAAEQPKVLSSDIKEVEAFLSGAIVKRNAKATVDAGVTELVFDKLPGTINQNNIGVTGTGDAVILSVVHRLNYLDPEKKNPEIKKLESILDSLNKHLDDLLDMKSVYTEEQNLILANKSIGGQNTGVTFENLEEMADFFRKRLADVKDKLTDLKYKEKKIHEEMDKYNHQLADKNTQYSKPTSSVTVTVSAKARTSVNLELTYFVPDAGWKPMYDLRAKDSNSPLAVNFKADVFQNTGEDWDKVNLTLSTGNPTSGGNKPDLQPWYLDFITTDMSLGYKSKNGYMAPSAARAEQAPPYNVYDSVTPADLETMKEYVSENSARFMASFTIGIPYSIPSDGKFYSAEIKRFDMPAEYTYFAIPKLDKDAFLVARSTGWEDLNLLPGEANVFFEGSFVGAIFLNTVSTEDTLDISLGRDKRINIEREKSKDVTGSGIFGGNKTRQFTYTISMRNIRKESVKLILEEQIPVSKQKDIDVKVLELSGGELNAETGKVTWRVELPPASTVKKTISFSVKYPKDKSITNL